jgi:hypothetical protein
MQRQGRIAMFSIPRVCAAAAIAFALTGCARGRSAEERINEARPMRAEIAEARRQLEAALASDAPGSSDLSRELAARDKVRALTCAKGFSPSFFQSQESIASNLTDQNCFDDYDRQTLQWLKSKKLYRLLAAGPLRALPASPVSIFATTGGVDSIRFASNAPVAVCTGNNTVEVIDIGTGTSLFLDRNLTESRSAAAIAPNGRVFVLSGAKGLSLRDAESGEVLLELPDYQRFAWLDSQTGIAVKRNVAAVDLIDFADSARAVAVRGVDASPTRILPLLGAEHEFLMGSYQSILRYALKRDANGVQAVLLDQRPGPTMGWSENTSEPTPKGTWLVQASSDLWITNLKTLESERIALKPFDARAVTPMPNADEVLLFGSFPAVGGARPLIYSISNRTFSPVEDDQFPATSGYSASRTVFIPLLNRLALINGTKVKMLEDVKRGPRYGLEALLQVLTDEQHALQEKNARDLATREGFQLAGVVDGVAVASSPLVSAAKDARVEAIGVYESANGSHGAGRPSIPGVITISLRPAGKPLVLVLSSYEPVLWKLAGADAANLKAVLLAGYSQSSTVSGEAGAQVVRMETREFAYAQSGSLGGLEREVVKRTGRRIDTLQRTYSGSSFVVGGR